MSQSPALTTDEQNALNGPSTIKRFLSPIPDTTVATALINQTTFVYSLAQLSVDTTSANWADVSEGMTIYVGTTAGAHDVFVGRIRKAGNSTTVYIGEVSSQDPGALPIDIRTASFANNQFITVLKRNDIWSILPIINVSSGVIKEDYDLAYAGQNATPPPIVNVTINGVRNHLATKIADGATLTITLAASVTKWPTSSGSSLTYAWSLPGSWTGTSGTTTASASGTASPGNYEVLLTVTDSIGGATKRVIFVNIHDDSTNPPLLISEMPTSDTRDRTGRRMSFGLNDTRLASLVDGGMVIYFEVPTWNGTDVPTATRQFVGWVQRRSRAGHEGLRDASIDIIGPAGVLGLINSTSQSFTVNASPSTWQQVVAGLSFETFVVWWMLKWRVANILRLFNFTPFSVAASGQRLVSWRVDKGTVLQQIQTLATERGNFGANSEGELFYLRHPSMTPYGSRSTVMRDTIDASKYASVGISEETIPRVSQIRGEGLSWDGSATTDTPYLADAPKTPGQGGVLGKLPSQVVTDQPELSQITGDFYALQNNRYPSVTWTVQKNRDVIEPAEMQFVALTVPANLSPTGSSFVKNIIPLSVSKRHNADGTADMNNTGEAETHNLAAGAVPVPEPNTSIFTPPDIPPAYDPLPLPTTGTIPIPSSIPPVTPGTDPYVSPGRGAIYNTSTACYRTYDLRPSSPTWDDVTPSGYTNISMMVMDQGGQFVRGVYTPPRAAYVLGDDGTDSWVSYTTDVFATTPVWTAQPSVTGIYSIIRSVKDIPGAIYIYSGSSGTTTYADDLTTALGAKSHVPSVSYPYGFWQNYPATYTGTSSSGTYSSSGGRTGGGCIQSQNTGYNDGIDFKMEASLIVDLGAEYVVTEASLWTKADAAGQNFGALIAFLDSGGTVLSRPDDLSLSTTSYRQFLWDGVQGGVRYVVFTAECNAATGNCYLDDVVVVYGDGVGASRYSTDFGATFGTARVVDTVIGTPGFDVGPRGIAALAGGDQRVRTALAGGAYSTTVNGGASGSYPISIDVPDFKIGSVSYFNPPADPNFYFASPDLIASHALWKVTLAGKVGITPTFSAVEGLGVTPFGLHSWKGKRLMFIAEFSTVRYMCQTSNSGATWARTAMSGALSIRARRFSVNGTEWIAAVGSTGLKYTSNFGASWSTKAITGSALYAEIYS